MRLWIAHPKYLDVQGVLRVWSDALLARSIFEGRRRGKRYKQQLAPYRKTRKPILAIDTYLYHISRDAKRRHIILSKHKLNDPLLRFRMPVTRVALREDFVHLQRALRRRKRRAAVRAGQRLAPHPLFRVTHIKKAVRRRKRHGHHSR